MTGLVSDCVRGVTSDSCGGRIYFLRQRTQVGVVHHALKELRIFSAIFRFTLEEKVVQTDRGSAEGIRLDDVRAGLEIPSVNLVDNVRLRQEQELDAPLQVFAFPIPKARAAIIRFGQLVLLDHRAHGAVEDDDAFAHQRFERMKDFGGHGEAELNRSSRGPARNKLTHHDA